MRSWWSAVAVGLSLLLLASSTGHAATVYACKKKVGGSVRLVARNAACLATEKKIWWNSSPKTINLNVFGAQLGFAANFAEGYGHLAGVNLPDGATATFGMGFTIPPDYTRGTPLTVHVLWHAEVVDCGIRFQPRYLSVARAESPHLVGPFANSGLTVEGGELLAAPPVALQSAETLLTIVSPDENLALAPRDAVNFGVLRNGNDAPDDTCAGNMRIQGLWVTYQ